MHTEHDHDDQQQEEQHGGHDERQPHCEGVKLILVELIELV